MSRYPIPARTHRVEQVVQRSRFITTLGHAPRREAAERLLESVRREMPDATHHCWAFVAGPPGSTTAIGMSDAGEPHGTAGRPMLDTLLHSGVGEIAAVVTRYFGGTRLGRGGLGRAYAGGVAEALASLPTVEKVERFLVRVRLEYASLEPVRRLCAELDAEVRSERFGEAVTLEVAVPVGEGERFGGGVAAITGGAARIERL